MATEMDEHFVFDLTLAQKHESLQQLGHQYALGLERNAQLNAANESLDQQIANKERHLNELSNRDGELSLLILQKKEEMRVFESQPPALRARFIQENAQLEQHHEEISAKCSQMGSRLLLYKQKFKILVLGPDAVFSQEKIDAAEALLDQDLVAEWGVKVFVLDKQHWQETARPEQRS